MSADHPLLTKLARVLDLSNDEAAAIRAVPVQMLMFRADKVIAHEGDRPSRSFLVHKGLTCSSKVADGGRRQIMTLQIPGDMPDLHSLQLRYLDSDIWAITDCDLAYLPHDELRKLSRACPRIMEELWRTTLVEGSIYREWMVNVALRRADSRMAHVFCEMMLRMQTVGLADGKTCPLAVTQGDLSEMTGLSQVHVNRTLQALRERGLISFAKGTLTIYDWDALVELGDFRPDYLHVREPEAVNRLANLTLDRR